MFRWERIVSSPVISSDNVNTEDNDILGKVIVFLRDEKPDLALQTLNLISDHDNPDFWYWRGEANRKANNLELSLECFEKVVEIDESRFTPYLIWAKYHIAKHLFASSYTTFEGSYEPEYDNEKLSEALGNFAEAIRLDAEGNDLIKLDDAARADIEKSRGFIYSISGLSDEAIICFERYLTVPGIGISGLIGPDGLIMTYWVRTYQYGDIYQDFRKWAARRIIEFENVNVNYLLEVMDQKYGNYFDWERNDAIISNFHDTIAEAIGLIGESGRMSLLKSLNHRRWPVRVGSAAALGHIGNIIDLKILELKMEEGKTSHDREACADALKEILDHNPDKIELNEAKRLFSKLTSFYLNLKENDEEIIQINSEAALCCINAALKRDPNDKNLLKNLAFVTLKNKNERAFIILKKNPEKALVLFKEILGKDSTNSEAIRGLGSAYHSLADYENAFDVLNTYLYENPQKAENHDIRVLRNTAKYRIIEKYMDEGNLFYDVGKIDEAKCKFEKVLAIDDSNVEALKKMILILKYRFESGKTKSYQ